MGISVKKTTTKHIIIDPKKILIRNVVQIFIDIWLR